MKTETLSKTFYGYIDATTGQHQKIAKRAGIAQATISRIYLRKASPTLRIVEALLSVKAEDEASALRVSHTKRGRVRRDLDTAPALAHPGE